MDDDDAVELVAKFRVSKRQLVSLLAGEAGAVDVDLQQHTTGYDVQQLHGGGHRRSGAPFGSSHDCRV